MSIFRRDSEPQQPVVPAATPVTPEPRSNRSSSPSPNPGGATNIASGTTVVGQISGSTQLVIDGQVDGEIDLQSQVIVGASGHVKGEIKAKAVQVGGKVQGNVRGHDRVEVLNSGSLEGDVVSPRVVIAEGAFFKGKVEMIDQSRGAAKGGPPHDKAGGKPGGTVPSKTPAGSAR